MKGTGIYIAILFVSPFSPAVLPTWQASSSRAAGNSPNVPRASTATLTGACAFLMYMTSRMR